MNYILNSNWRGISTDLLNKSVQTGDVPWEWRDALIVSLYKNGNRREPYTYRPVSLTSIVCRVSVGLLPKYCGKGILFHDRFRRPSTALDVTRRTFIPGISIAPLQVLYYSEVLPTTARILYR